MAHSNDPLGRLHRRDRIPVRAASSSPLYYVPSRFSVFFRRGFAMSMKSRCASLIVAAMLLAASSSHAANFCLTLGSAQVVASGLTIPVKGTCASFNGFYRGPSNAGLLLAGDICKSSDGSTVIFNTFTQHNGQPDSLVGAWLTAKGTGSGNECTAGAKCLAFAVTVTKCPANPPIPAVRAELPLQEQSSATFTTEEP